ncbi:TonB-dependent receptor [uncultured Alteromonas sp.]|jgi:iron complex outermembrane receptor protein|uniref:TonB-dependent receptor n=1 Tax=uncultured Alteromonas sp. TaxID=179113 RepID=UPI0025E75425|nr:TonB-dependent receptor [uncultured Alteromonas sp.]
MTRKNLVRTAVLIGLFGGGSAVAQTAEVESKESDKKSNDGFEVILVKAQRTAQNLQEVPVSVQALSAADLTKQNINELTQLSQIAPTLQIGQDNTYAIRGIGSQISTGTTDPSVALAIDGVSLGRNTLGAVPFNDIASVEVLNGPQGLLFGKNASAGLVNITTNKPYIGETSGNINLEYNKRSTTPTGAVGKVVNGTINLPVSDNSALRINAHWSDQDALTENVAPSPDKKVDPDQRKASIKAKYLYDNGPLSIYLIADYTENTGNGERFSRTYRNVDEASEINDLLDANGIVPGPENFQNDADGEHYGNVEIGGAQAEISYLFENGIELINLAAYRYFDSERSIYGDFSALVDQVVNTNQTEYDQFSNELRLVIPQNDNYSGQLGLFYFKSTSDIDAILEVVGPPPFVAVEFPFCVGAEISGPPPGCPYSNDVFLGSDSITKFDQTSYAVFGQFDFYITDQLTAIAGARVTRDEVDTDVLQQQRNYFVSIGGATGRFIDSIDNTNLSWKVGLNYQAKDDVMLFGTIGQGYKGPGFNTENLGLEEVPFAVEDEVSTTIEAGIRSKLFDDRVIFNVTFFNTDFDNYQAQSFNLDAQGFILQNAATVTSRGAEIAVKVWATDNLTLTWDTSLLDSTFDEFEGASCTPDSLECGSEDTFFDASGYPTPLSADVTSSLQASYERELSGSMYGFINASMYYRSELNYGIASPERVIGSVTTFNINMGISTYDGWRAAIFCNNCTDEKVPTSIAFDPGENNRGFESTQQSWGLNSVRSIGISVSKTF